MGRWVNRLSSGKTERLNAYTWPASPNAGSRTEISTLLTLLNYGNWPEMPRIPRFPPDPGWGHVGPGVPPPPSTDCKDPACHKCGPEVSTGLFYTLENVRRKYDHLRRTDPEEAERVCGMWELAGHWDINWPAMPPGCAQKGTPCYETVMVLGTCYDRWAVNYLMFGQICRLCNYSWVQMQAMIGAHKTRKYVCGNPWQWTRDVLGFAGLGYSYPNLPTPPTLPPSGSQAGCRKCDTSDPKYGWIFRTNWPYPDPGDRPGAPIRPH
jgi:hypothetical protein